MTDEPRPAIGQLAMALSTDIRELATEAAKYRIAYERLTAAIDQLKAREPYLALEADLVAVLEGKVRGMSEDEDGLSDLEGGANDERHTISRLSAEVEALRELVRELEDALHYVTDGLDVQD